MINPLTGHYFFRCFYGFEFGKLNAGFILYEVFGDYPCLPGPQRGAFFCFCKCFLETVKITSGGEGNPCFIWFMFPVVSDCPGVEMV